MTVGWYPMDGMYPGDGDIQDEDDLLEEMDAQLFLPGDGHDSAYREEL